MEDQIKFRILLLARDLDDVGPISQVLQREGYRVECLSSGEEAVAQAYRGKVDLILSQIDLPVIDGWELLKRIRNDFQARRIPVVFLLKEADSDLTLQALKAGAKDCLGLSTDVQLILWKINVLLDLVRSEQNWQKLIGDLTREIVLRTEVEIDLRAKREELEHFALMDALTKIPNRRKLNESMGREWGDMKRKQSSISFLMCDIDYFKLYNDTFGHQAGDSCLVKVARAVDQATNRPTDLAARFGGEEFALLLPETGLNGAIFVAEKIIANIHRLGLFHPATKVDNVEQVTVSIGIHSMIPHDHVELEELIERADRALYYAKHHGRNQVALCDERGDCHVQNINR